MGCKTVLVVEDDPVIAELVHELLEDEGFRVELAANGIEGLARMPRVRPDVVLSDIMMPHLDGRQLCDRIQADPELRATPVILMSASSEYRLREGCPHAAFIAKPFHFDTMLETLERVIADAGN